MYLAQSTINGFVPDLVATLRSCFVNSQGHLFIGQYYAWCGYSLRTIIWLSPVPTPNGFNETTMDVRRCHDRARRGLGTRNVWSLATRSCRFEFAIADDRIFLGFQSSPGVPRTASVPRLPYWGIELGLCELTVKRYFTARMSTETSVSVSGPSESDCLRLVGTV